MKKNNFQINILILWSFIGISLLFAEETHIMPLGDSITFDAKYDDTRDDSERTGYRSHLWYKLQAASYEADFVGSQVAGESVTPAFDPDNEGYPGINTYRLEDNTYEYLTNNPADIILLHIGTNDHRTSTEGVEQILDWVDLYEVEHSHSIKVIVALIIDRQEPDSTIASFNYNLKETIGRRIRNGDLLTLVDMYDGAGLTTADYVDDTHPNDNGYRKMAEVWFQALINPYTPGLHAFPFTLVDKIYIDRKTIVVSNTLNTVEFITEIPDNGIRF